MDEYHRIAAVQEKHWWYVNTRLLMLEFLGPWLAADQKIIDVGCGPGSNARALTVHGRVTGIDRAPEALVWIRRRSGVRAVRADAAALPVPSGVVDVAICVHVLYTLADHHRALGELARVLAPGGVAFLMEPAFPVLRRGHDRKVHGARRFRRGELLLSAAPGEHGWSVLRHGWRARVGGRGGGAMWVGRRGGGLAGGARGGQRELVLNAQGPPR